MDNLTLPASDLLVKLPDGRNYRFQGWLLAERSSWRICSDHWTIIRIYKVKADPVEYLASVLALTSVIGESVRGKVFRSKDQETIVQSIGNSGLAQDAYCDAGWR